MGIPIPNYLHIFDSNVDKFYINENKDIVKDLFQHIKKEYSIKDLCKFLNFPSSRILYYYLSGERVPSVNTLFKLISLLNKEEIKDELYNYFKGIYTRGHFADKLPKSFSSELAYLVGIICGDGHISKRTEITITNESEDYIKNIVAPIFKKIFNVNPYFTYEKTYIVMIVSSKPVHAFLTKIIGIPKGKKKGALKVPEFIYFTKEFKIKFIQGLFETDGGLTCDKKGRKSILISSSTIEFLKEVQEILKELGINLGGPYKSGSGQGNEIRSFKNRELINFKNKVKLIHPYKKKKLNALVA